MEKMQATSKDLLAENIEKVKVLFPEAFTEDKIDFEVLQELLGQYIDKEKERYSFTWAGKQKARREAQKVSTGTLRPCKEESVNFDKTENLYIEGDNLEVLKLLQKSYHNSVKMIYIDPPYNTGNDILYKNNYADNISEYLKLSKQIDQDKLPLTTNLQSSGRFHSNWLSMMFPRLKLARNLLRNDGFIAIAIDHNEINTLINISDEIFGRENRVGFITVVHKPEGRNQAKFFAPSNEFMLFYAKDINKAKLRNVVIDDDIQRTFDRQDSKGKFRLNNYLRSGGGDHNLRVNKPHFFYSIYVSDDLSHITTTPTEGYHEILPITKSGQERTWKTIKETFLERLKDGEILSEMDNNGKIQVYEKYRENQIFKTHWQLPKYHSIHHGTNVVRQLLGKPYFDFPKSVHLVKDALKIITCNDDLIIDFFSGSATTAHAIMKLNKEDGGNRRYILVQLPEPLSEKSEAYRDGYKTIAEIGKERIRRVIQKMQNSECTIDNEEKAIENGQLNIDNLEESNNSELSIMNSELEKDLGFKVFKLDTSNIKPWNPQTQDLEADLPNVVDNIVENRTEEDVLYEIMLKYGLALTLLIENVELIIDNGKRKVNIFNVGMGALIACLNDNITLEIVEEIAKLKEELNPENCRVVFMDKGFGDDDTLKLNAIQILSRYGIEEIRSI